MTTNILILAQSWPVEVQSIDDYGNGPVVADIIRVEPNTHRQVYITQNRELKIKELPRDGEQS